MVLDKKEPIETTSSTVMKSDHAVLKDMLSHFTSQLMHVSTIGVSTSSGSKVMMSFHLFSNVKSCLISAYDVMLSIPL